MKHLLKLSAVAIFALSTNVALANDKVGFVNPEYLLQNHPDMVAAAKKIEQHSLDIKKKYAAEEKSLGDEDKSLTEEFQKLDSEAEKLLKEQELVDASLKKKIKSLDKDAPKLRQKELKARQDQIVAEQTAFQKKVSALQERESAFNVRTEAFKKKVDEFNKKVAKEQQNTGLDIRAIQQKATSDINLALKKVSDAQGYTVVLPINIALYAKSTNVDLSKAVLTEVEQMVKSEAKK